jgi:hypothetical protein
MVINGHLPSPSGERGLPLPPPPERLMGGQAASTHPTTPALEGGGVLFMPFLGGMPYKKGEKSAPLPPEPGGTRFGCPKGHVGRGMEGCPPISPERGRRTKRLCDFSTTFVAEKSRKSLFSPFPLGKGAGGVGLLLLFFLLSACTSAPISAGTTGAAQTAIASAVAATLTEAPHLTETATLQSTPSPSKTPSPSPVPSAAPTTGPSPTPTPDTRPDPNNWMAWPVIPTVSARARSIYQAGLAKGNDPQSFSTIGDCQSEPNVFLGIYDTNRYILGKDDGYLQATIDYFHGVFERQSLSVRDGLSAPSALSATWAYKDKCQVNENPVQCELRTHKPAVMFINLGTNWRADASTDAYEKYLRQIVDLVIANGTVPVLATKADNVEGGNRINQATARVAHDYDVPLWNFWVTAQYLPNHGLDKTRQDVYLTVEAWDARSYGGLKVLDLLRNKLPESSQ